MDGAFDLSTTYVHLGLGATVIPLPGFGWDEESLERYTTEHGSDGDEGRLVVLSESRSDWTVWECHPNGDELVVLLDGSATVVQEADPGPRRVRLCPGDAVVNPRGVWHTADIHEPCRFLYVTSGRGTMHRDR